jgi:ABC-type glycerol-3-phosphate transport system substrate-binding protein
MFRWLVPLLAFFILTVPGCQITRPVEPTAPTSQPAPLSTVAPSRRPTPPTAPASAPALAPPLALTLTVWLPDALIPPGNVQAGAVLTQQIEAFAATQPNVHVEVLPKRARGPADILELMQASAPVAPSYLPDVTLLDLSQIPAATQSGLLRPLNGLVPDDTFADLFPFAVQAGRSEDRWAAIAYVADMEHLAFNSARIPSPPITWAQVLSASQPYLFPAGINGETVSDALLAQYAAAGGRWMDASGQPSLDAVPLAQMLNQLKAAQQAGAISANVLNFASADDTWQAYLGQPGQMVNVRASRFIAQRAAISGTLAAPLPGYSGEPARPIARGWAFVVPTRDLARAAAAAALIKWLVSPENEGAWAHSANLLPARRGAFDHWYPPYIYVAFARQELDRAVAPPPAYVAQIVGPAIQKAVADVLRGLAQPTEAATAAAASIARASQ